MDVVMYRGALCIKRQSLIKSPDNPNGIMPAGTLNAMSYRRTIYTMNAAGGEGNPALIAFDSLPHKYKSVIRELYPDIEKAAHITNFLDELEEDPMAVDFYNKYSFIYSDNPKGLSDAHKEEYVNSAKILNAIARKWEEHKEERAKQGKRPLVKQFWTTQVEVISRLPNSFRHMLPITSHRSLQRRFEQYFPNDYESLISNKFRNNNTAKITADVGEWLVAQWMSHINRVTIEQLHARYDKVRHEMGWKEIKESKTIRDYLYRPEIERVWYAARRGELLSKEKFQRQNRTILPELRDSLWYSDGTKMNLYYQDAEGNMKTCQVYEVMDVATEVFLGCHFSKTEDFEAQYMAYKNAIRFSAHRPYEIKYDNQGGHRRLENSDFLNNLAKYSIRTAPYNGKSKTIESAFGRFQSQYLHEVWYFTGQNITATKEESRVNIEMILANQKQLPTYEEAIAKYMELRTKWNNAKHYRTGISKMEMYRTSINPETVEVDIFDMLDMFGTTTKEPSTYRSSGIEIQVKKQTYAYEVLGADGEPDRSFNRRNIGRRFHVRYDLEDMSVVSLYEKDSEGQLRFITMAQTYLTVHRAKQDQSSYDLHIIRQNEHRNKEERVADELERNAILEKHGLHPNQHGLNVAPLKGINTGNRKKKDVGELQKELSNITAAEEVIKKERRDNRKAERELEAQQLRREEEQREFDRKRKELYELKLN